MLNLKKNPFSLSTHLHRLHLFVVFFLVGSISFFAQYTEVINSNKPGFSESPYSVGTGVYQFESNLFFRSTNTIPTFSRPQSLGLDFMFRTGLLLEKLEFNARVAFQEDKVAFKNIFTSHYSTAGFSRLTVGAKYLLYQQEYQDKSKEIRSWKKRNSFDLKRLIPSVALSLAINTDFINDIHKTGSITPKAGILLQHNLTDNFNLITNIFYDYIGSDLSEFSYIVTATQSFSDRWSVFFENETIFKESQNKTNLALGIAYLYSRNLQFNSSGRFIFEGETQGFYAGLGISYRINRHVDSYIELDENGNKLEDAPSNNKRKNFFNGLFRVFKKKDKSIITEPEKPKKGKKNNN